MFKMPLITAKKIYEKRSEVSCWMHNSCGIEIGPTSSFTLTVVHKVADGPHIYLFCSKPALYG